MSAVENDPQNEFVVVAEDSAPNRAILVLLLKKLGYQVLECGDGAESWEHLNAKDGHNIVCVISDIMMPNMDGLELLRRVRGDESLKKLPFLLVTAVSDKDYIFEARNLAVTGYLLKPITYQRVSAKLRELFPGRHFPKMTG